MVNISSKLTDLLDNKELIDIRLIVQGDIYEVHKLVLGANSPVFKAMFTDHRWTKSEKDSIDLNEEPCCITVFPLFLRYMYTNVVEFTLSNVLPLMILSDKYEVMDLLHLCLYYMNCHISEAIDNGEIFFWHQYCIASRQHNVQFLEDFICSNFSLIIENDYFVQLSYDILQYFLSKSNLVIKNESCLQQAMLQWYEANKSKHLHCNLAYDCLRAPYFSMDLLIDIFNKKADSSLKYNLNVATKFHTFNTKERNMIKWGNEKILISPRIYTSELWSTTFVIPNFSKFPSYGVRTEIFSTLSSASRADSKTFWEWTLDFYPKGIRYDKSLFISTNKTYELPGLAINSVQAKLTATGNLCAQSRKVDVYFLFYSTNSSNLNTSSNNSSPIITPDVEHGRQLPNSSHSFDMSMDEGTEYVKKVVKRSNCYFNDTIRSSALNPPTTWFESDTGEILDLRPCTRNFYPDYNSSYHHDHRYHMRSLNARDKYDGSDASGDDSQTAMKFEDLVPFTRLNPSNAQICNKHFRKYRSSFLHKSDHLLLGDIDALKVTVIILPCV